MLVVSSGSSGSAFLNNHTVAGGAILHYRYALPEPLAEDMKALGPSARRGRAGRRARSIRRRRVPEGRHSARRSVGDGDVARATSTPPRTTRASAHPTTVEVLRHVDAEIKRIEDGLKAAGLFDELQHLGHLRPRLLDPHRRRRSRRGAEAVRRRASRRLAAHRRQRRRDLRARRRRSGRLGDRRRACSRRRASARSSPARRAPDRSTGACRARCRSTRRGGITIGPRRSCSRRTGPTRANAHGMRGTVASGGVGGTRQLEPVGHPQHADCRRARPEAGRHDRRAERERRLRADVPGCSACRFPPSMQGRPLEEALRGRPDASAVTFTHTVRTR